VALATVDPSRSKFQQKFSEKKTSSTLDNKPAAETQREWKSLISPIGLLIRETRPTRRKQRKMEFLRKRATIQRRSQCLAVGEQRKLPDAQRRYFSVSMD
jgi:hypothetical protein